MTGEKLYEILGEMDDKYVSEAKEKRKAINYRAWGMIAACVCILIGGATFLKSNSVNNHSDTEVVQLPNPLVEVQSLEEMENELDFKVPTLEKEVETYIIINGEDSKSARIMYADGSVFDMAHGTGDISGIWGGTFEKEEQIDNVNVSFYKYKGEENTINYVLWEKDGFTYSYSGKEISVDEIQSLVRQ